MSNMFSAGNSAIGYLYQIRYALLMILKNNDKDISIENLDDIEFGKEGTPIELLQLKHHSSKRVANLSNGSSDFWKSIRIWAEAVKNNSIRVPGVFFSLVTTALASPNSAIYYLKNDNNRNSKEAHIALLNHITASKSEGNKVAYDSFLSLDSDQQFRLIDSIYVLDQAENMIDVVDTIKNELRLVVKHELIEPFYERLEGWWFEETVKHLFYGSKDPIRGSEVHRKIQDIRDNLKPDALPIDFANAEPSETEQIWDERIFVHQLNAIAVSHPRVKRAIKDFYRASNQRARWIADQLVSISELEDYERKLIEEWEEQFAMAEEGISDYSDEHLQKSGRVLYNEVMRIPYLNIRQNVTERYVMQGSFHILSDQIPFRIGWHLQYNDKLAYLKKKELDKHE
ncbi:ABC-three component system protein [uncultured Psychrobacillus sp.]|uniref:ABC-three component system protein n=1 Tax=uncultured Psychrobacillus sp. TaxID=1551585 RepID=UPI0026287D45|nr:ABC-three component system protein [uncultured Psychrobacillus sp.]